MRGSSLLLAAVPIVISALLVPPALADDGLSTRAILVDRHRRWSEFKNILKNSVIRTLLRRDRASRSR